MYTHRGNVIKVMADKQRTNTTSVQLSLVFCFTEQIFEALTDVGLHPTDILCEPISDYS